MLTALFLPDSTTLSHSDLCHIEPFVITEFHITQGLRRFHSVGFQACVLDLSILHCSAQNSLTAREILWFPVILLSPDASAVPISCFFVVGREGPTLVPGGLQKLCSWFSLAHQGITLSLAVMLAKVLNCGACMHAPLVLDSSCIPIHSG